MPFEDPGTSALLVPKGGCIMRFSFVNGHREVLLGDLLFKANIMSRLGNAPALPKDSALSS